MSKPPKIVIPGMNRGAGIPPGYILGRLPGTGKGPAQLLDLTSVKKVGIATTSGVVASTSQAVSIAQSDTASLSTAVSSADSGQSASISQISSSLSGAISSTTSLSSGVSTVDSNQSTSLSQVSSSLSGAISSTTSLSAAVSTVDAGKANLTGGNSFTGNQSLAGDLTLTTGVITAAPNSVNYLGTVFTLDTNAPTHYSGAVFHDQLGAAVAFLLVGSTSDPTMYWQSDTIRFTDVAGFNDMLIVTTANVQVKAANVTELTVTAAGVDFRQAPTVGGVPLTNSLSTAISTVDSNQNTSLSQVSSSLSGAISSTTSLSSGVSTVDNNQSTSLSQISSSLSGAISSTTSLSTAGPVVHPGYIAGNWYCPIHGCSLAIGAAVPANTIRLLPFTISKPITVSDLGARITTLSGGGNCQLAIYAYNVATARPTGNALCSTGNISTGATGPVSATVGASPPTLAPGAYWMAINQDNSTAVYQTLASAASNGVFLIGSATLANVTSGPALVPFSLVVSQTFGTWPDLTSAAFSEVTNANNAIVFLKAA